MRKIVKPAGVFWTKPHSQSPTTLELLQKEIFGNQNLKNVGKMINLLNSETRLQIIVLLSKKSPLCVGDMADTLRISFSSISHQLRILKKANLVGAKRKKKVVYYRLNEVLPALVLNLIKDSG